MVEILFMVFVLRVLIVVFVGIFVLFEIGVCVIFVVKCLGIMLLGLLVGFFF